MERTEINVNVNVLLIVSGSVSRSVCVADYYLLMLLWNSECHNFKLQNVRTKTLKQSLTARTLTRHKCTPHLSFMQTHYFTLFAATYNITAREFCVSPIPLRSLHTVWLWENPSYQSSLSLIPWLFLHMTRNPLPPPLQLSTPLKWRIVIWQSCRLM